VLVHLDPGSATPPYEQVRAQLAERINDGSLAVGSKLPTVRALATELGIAPNTIARAYRELEETGLLETRGRAGTFVGASGDESRERARRAASEYAATVHGLGIGADEAIAIVTAAVRG
jgi:DNA-binding transcriptional regulator YhcF (GntR family)